MKKTAAEIADEVLAKIATEPAGAAAPGAKKPTPAQSAVQQAYKKHTQGAGYGAAPQVRLPGRKTTTVR